MITADTVTNEMIEALRNEARAVAADCDASGENPGDMGARVRACNAALGLPTSDGALGLLDQRACRERVAEIIAQEGTARHYGLLTAETISDAEIGQLRNSLLKFSGQPGAYELIVDCHVALRPRARKHQRSAARARCAAALNARAKADLGRTKEAK